MRCTIWKSWLTGLLMLVAVGRANAGLELFAMSVSQQRLMTADLETAALEEVGSVGTFIQDIAFNTRDGFLYGYDFQFDQHLLRIDPTDASTAPIGVPITEFGWSNVHGMAYDPCRDQIYATLAASNELLEIDPGTGAPSLIGVMDERAWGLAYEIHDDLLYGITVFEPKLVMIDITDASQTLIGPVDDHVEGLAFNPSNGLLYAVFLEQPFEDSLLVAIDPDTAKADPIGPIQSDDFIAGLAFGDPCPADLDGDGIVGTTDLLKLLLAWGTDPGGPPDLDGDGIVAVTDLLELLATWGPCP